MVSTHKKRQSNRRLLSRLDALDRNVTIFNAASERQENMVVDEGTNDQHFTVGTSSDNLVTNENTVNVKSLENVLMKVLTRK